MRYSRKTLRRLRPAARAIAELANEADTMNRRLRALVIRVVFERRWNPAPAAFDGSRGLYASDHDLFAFMVDNNRRIFETAPGGGLSRGFFVWNSEVGAASFGIQKFFYNYVCGNHNVWGARDITELRIPHVGDADKEAFGKITLELKRYAEGSTVDDETFIKGAMRKQIAATKDEVLDRIFGLRVGPLSYKTIQDAYELAEEHTDWYGDPKSVWGLANGITELAGKLPHADRRVELERASGKVMAMAF